MRLWRSSTTIWGVLQSDSLERGVRMCCLSSTMARCVEIEDDIDMTKDCEAEDEFGVFAGFDGLLAHDAIVGTILYKLRM